MMRKGGSVLILLCKLLLTFSLSSRREKRFSGTSPGAMPLASGSRVAAAAGSGRPSGAARDDIGAPSVSGQSACGWAPWVEGRAPVSWDASATAKGGVPLSDASFRGDAARWRFGTKTFASDFDGGNLQKVERVTDKSFNLWTRCDNQGTPHETHHRTWFHFKASGFNKGDVVTFTFPDFNKQRNLFANDFRPVFWEYNSGDNTETHKGSTDSSTGVSDDCTNRADRVGKDSRNVTTYKRIPQPVTARASKSGQFKVSFRHEFTSNISNSCVFFALTFPWGYHDTLSMLDNIDDRFAESGERGLELNKHIRYERKVLTKSCEGRLVEAITIASTITPSASTKQTFVVTCGVHPGEKPANHLFNGMLEFLLRPDDPRSQKLRDVYDFVLVPMLNPDGAFRGHYRNDALGQNLNRFYAEPCATKQPSCAALKALLTQLADNNILAFYIDLHAHANKRGVFAFGNACDGANAVETRTYARLCSLNSPHFDLAHCNFSERNMASRDKNGDSKAGTGRVALFRDTNGSVPHLYTVEANYNCSRLLNETPRATNARGDVVDLDFYEKRRLTDGAAKTPERSASNAGRKYTTHGRKKYDPPLFHGVARALLIAALDLSDQNPWSTVPSSQFKTVNGIRNWARAAARGDCARRKVQHADMESDKDASDDEDEFSGVGVSGSVRNSVSRRASTKKGDRLLPANSHSTKICSTFEGTAGGRHVLSSDNVVWPNKQHLVVDKSAPKWRT